MQILKEKNNRAGLIGTILFHALLLILFLFVGMSYPDPPPPEEGITINFGDSDEGMGETQTDELSSSSNATTEEVVNPNATSSSAETNLTTQNTTETVNVNASNNSSQPKNTTQQTTTSQQSTSQNLSEALNAFNNSGSASTSDGTTGNPGNQGSLNGDPNSNNYTGGGSGDGVKWNLAGRTPLSLPKIEDNSQEQGTVVVDIVVDKNGKVIKATPGSRGSTTTSPILYKKAVEAALRTKFNAKPDLVSDQKGTMTFVFLLN